MTITRILEEAGFNSEANLFAALHNSEYEVRRLVVDSLVHDGVDRQGAKRRWAEFVRARDCAAPETMERFLSHSRMMVPSDTFSKLERLTQNVATVDELRTLVRKGSVNTDVESMATIATIATVSYESDFLSFRDELAILNSVEKFLSRKKDDKTTKFVRDSVHDKIFFPIWIWRDIIDDPVVQRLRRLSQLGTAMYVYPTARQSRFEHSLGVGHLAGIWFDKLSEKLTNINRGCVSAYRDCINIGGICHDLGHGPFSHAFEDFLESFVHENQTIKMFDYLAEKNNLYDKLDKYDNLTDLIKNIILGNYKKEKGDILLSYSPMDELRIASCQIVCNNLNGIDVDRIDYILRDSLTIQRSHRLDYDRIMRHSNIINSEICFNIKEKSNLFRIYKERYELFDEIYLHPVNISIQLMFQDIFKELDPLIHFNEVVNHPEEFVEMTDDLFHVSKDPLTYYSRAKKYYSGTSSGNSGTSGSSGKLTESLFLDEYSENLKRAYNLYDRILHRQNIYKYIGDLKPSDGIQISVNEILSYDDSSVLKAEDLIVVNNKLHYGTNFEDPFENIGFYSPNDESTRLAAPSDITFPVNWGQQISRIYCRKPELKTLAVKAWEKYHQTKFGNQRESKNGSRDGSRSASRSGDTPKCFSPTIPGSSRRSMIHENKNSGLPWSTLSSFPTI